MYSVILCGGSGTRLWPLSRKNYAKQFLSLYSDKSLVQETYLRTRKMTDRKNIFFVTNQDNFFNVFNQIREVDKSFKKENIITELSSRNTAPAITLAVKFLQEKTKIKEDEPIIFLPADHYIKDEKRFLSLVKRAATGVKDRVGTIGITPSGPNTDYGYIKKGKKEKDCFRVAGFKEKPGAKSVKEYLRGQKYLWNSGIYIFNIPTYFRELEKCCPEIAKKTGSLDRLVKQFEKLPRVSIDYAISEKSDNMIVFPGNFGWNDIVSFDNMLKISPNNDPKHISIDSKNIFVHSASNRLVATLGIDNINIVETADSILVQKQGHGADVKKVVDYLDRKNMKELEHNLIVHRPWGKYEVLIDSPDHKVKKITVYPGSKLSLQSHRFRTEHWVVVKGTATVVNGDREIILKHNESTYIPTHTKHRLSNPGKMNLEIVEVQTGSYLEEDDIIRYEDIYDRPKQFKNSLK